MSRGAGFADHMCHGRRSLRDRGGGGGLKFSSVQVKNNKKI